MKENEKNVASSCNLAWSALYDLSKKYNVNISGLLIFSSNESDKNQRVSITQQINIIAQE